MREKLHPDRETLERFVRGEAPGEEELRIERHLRSGCPVCQLSVDEMLPGFEPGRQSGSDPGDEPAGPPREAAETAAESAEWEALFARLDERVLAVLREKEEAPGIVDEILAQPAEAGQDLIYSAPRFQTFAVCDLLIDKTLEAGFRNPMRSLQLARLGVVAADRLDARVYGRPVVQDLRARAWAHLGNARRIGSDFAGAERALAFAAELAETGSGDPLEEARVLDFEASLLSDLGRHGEAIGRIDQVIEIYDEVHDLHRKGRALLSKGFFLGCAGEPEPAIDLITRGLARVRWNEEPRLVLAARYNLIGFLIDCGRCEQARLQIGRLAEAYRRSPDPWTEPRLAWLEGRLAAGLGDFAEAETTLRRARWLFLVTEREYDAVLATLDLAAVFIRLGRIAEVRQLTEEMLPLLLRQDLYRPAITALLAFQRAADRGTLTPRWIQEIASYLLRARRNPRLAFHEAAAA